MYIYEDEKQYIINEDGFITTINKTINPALAAMRATIIRLTDQLRLLDQDMIRLQQKVNTVTELKE